MSQPAPWCLASTPAGRNILPRWDQMAANNRDTVNNLVDRVVAMPSNCGCGRTHYDHLMVTVGVLGELNIEPGTLVSLLAEALHQLAAAKFSGADR